MSWDLSSEEAICNKLESQQTVIFAFSKKIKELEAKNGELDKQVKQLEKIINSNEGDYDFMMYNFEKYKQALAAIKEKEV